MGLIAILGVAYEGVVVGAAMRSGWLEAASADRWRWLFVRTLPIALVANAVVAWGSLSGSLYGFETWAAALASIAFVVGAPSGALTIATGVALALRGQPAGDRARRRREIGAQHLPHPVARDDDARPGVRARPLRDDHPRAGAGARGGALRGPGPARGALRAALPLRARRVALAGGDVRPTAESTRAGWRP